MSGQLIPQDDSQAQSLIADWSDVPYDRHPAAVYLAGLNSPHSRRTMRNALNKIASLVSGGQADALSLNWSALRYQHTAAIRARLSEEYKPATVNTMLSGLRGVLDAAWRLGYMTADDYHAAAAVKSVKNLTLPAGRELQNGEIWALLDACMRDPGPAGVRDAALVAILYGAGLRRAEIVGLDFGDYDLESGKLVVRGKGRKERIAWLTGGTASAMADWLHLRADDDGPLFWHINKGGELVNRRLTTQAIYHILRKRANEAHIRDFSPHDLRRTFVSDLLDAGADIATVARMAGHANIQTTARYDRRPEEAKRKAAGLLHVPYRPKYEDS
jgi:site-specific recombinase XerC